MDGAPTFFPNWGLGAKSARNLGRALLVCILLGVAARASTAQDTQPVQTVQNTVQNLLTAEDGQTEQTTPQPGQATAPAAQPQPTSTIAAQEQARKEAQNPIASVISLPIQENWNFNIGQANRVQNVMNIQPVIPVGLGEHWNLITRWVTPIIYQPYAVPIPQPSGPPVLFQTGAYGLGDMQPQFFFSPKHSKVTWGAGPIFLVPTASQALLSQGKFGIGPTFVALVQPKFGTVGVLVNNIWSVAGHQDKPDVNQFYLQPFLNYNLHHAWYLSLTTSGITANWEKTNGGRWVVPIGGGPGRIWKLGHQTVNVQTFFFGNVVHPPGASPWTFRMAFTLLFPKTR
jgi:hypothetical protein